MRRHSASRLLSIVGSFVVALAIIGPASAQIRPICESGDVCDPFPTEPDNAQEQCEADLALCQSDSATCDADFDSCTTEFSSSQMMLGRCEADELGLLASLDDCERGPALIGDVNRDGVVDLLDDALLGRRLAGLPVEAPMPAVRALEVRRADKDKLLKNFQDGDAYSLSSRATSCVAIQIELNEAGSSLRYDWTPPSGNTIEGYSSDDEAPFCWPIEDGWTFEPEIADCGCRSEMNQLGDHVLVVVPCSVDVDFGLGESCLGNGGVEGPATTLHFSIVP